MNAISNVFASLLVRYRQQVTDLDAADRSDAERLTVASQNTLQELTETRPRSAASLADKVQTLIDRYDDFGAVPMDHVRQLLLDAHHLAVEPGMTMAWVHLWHDLGCNLVLQPTGDARCYGIREPLQVGHRYTGKLPPHLVLRGEDEANGAAKTLQAIIRLAGERAASAVFSYAGYEREAGTTLQAINGLDGVDTQAWADAVRSLEQANADLAAANSDDDGEEGAFTKVASAHARAADLLLRTPAPDRGALAYKLDLLASEYPDVPVEADILDIVAADGRRLLVGER